MKTYGTLTRTPQGWTVTASPHVITRLKRLFNRASSDQPGTIHLSATADIALDLEWICTRYPLDAKPATIETLSAEADAARQRDEQIHLILSGEHRPTGPLEPARALRNYQTLAADLAFTTGRLLLADDVGLGKTTSAAGLFRDPETLPAVVVTLTHLATPGQRLDGSPRSQWARELNTIFPDLEVHVAKRGTPYSLDIPADVIVINYHKLAGWADWLADGGVNTVIFDECQELRRPASRKYEAAQAVAAAASWRVGLSATPIYNYGPELWHVMEVIAPGELGTKAEFGREWCGTATWADQTVISDMAGLSASLRDRGLMLRRNRADVGRELPAVERIVHDLPANESVMAEAMADVDRLAATLLAPHIDQLTRGRAGRQFDLRLRQATGVAKAPYVAQFARMLLEQGPVVLYGWHRAVYSIWEDKLAEASPAFYTGSETVAGKDQSITRFLAGDTDLLILSLRSGAGVDGLQQRASTVVFGELDWSPGVHEQCIGRVHRDGQTEPVAAFYLVCDFGSDPTVISTLGIKREQVERLREPTSPSFEMAQVTTGRIRRLAEHWLSSRGIDIEHAINQIPLQLPLGSVTEPAAPHSKVDVAP